MEKILGYDYFFPSNPSRRTEEVQHCENYVYILVLLQTVYCKSYYSPYEHQWPLKSVCNSVSIDSFINLLYLCISWGEGTDTTLRSQPKGRGIILGRSAGEWPFGSKKSGHILHTDPRLKYRFIVILQNASQWHVLFLYLHLIFSVDLAVSLFDECWSAVCTDYTEACKLESPPCITNWPFDKQQIIVQPLKLHSTRTSKSISKSYKCNKEDLRLHFLLDEIVTLELEYILNHLNSMVYICNSVGGRLLIYKLKNPSQPGKWSRSGFQNNRQMSKIFSTNFFCYNGNASLANYA